MCNLVINVLLVSNESYFSTSQDENMLTNIKYKRRYISNLVRTGRLWNSHSQKVGKPNDLTVFGIIKSKLSGYLISNRLPMHFC